LKRYEGGWAVITGATNGIGKGFAQALAEKGFNIVIIGWNQELMNEVSKELES